MSTWGKLFKKVEDVIETALAKREEDKPAEVEPPEVEEGYGSSRPNYDPIADKVAEIVLARLGKGDSITTGVKPMAIKSECPVCGQRRTDNIIAGLQEEYLDFSGEFNEKRFKESLTCRRCGIGFGDDFDKIERAKKEWVKLVKDAESEADIRKAAEKQTREAVQHMYAFSTANDDEKTKK